MVVLAAHLRLYEERSLSFHFAVQISPTGVGSGTLDALSDGADEEDEEEASAEEADDASSEAKAAAAKNAGARTVESLMISYGFFWKIRSVLMRIVLQYKKSIDPWI